MKTEQEIRARIAEQVEYMSKKGTSWDEVLLHASAIHALQWVLED